MNKNTFKAQALAMVMVVLVVASIIGVSLFSRMSKDKQASVNEQDSSISLSLVDATLDFFVGADIEKVEAVLNDDMAEKGGTFTTVKGVAEYLKAQEIVEVDPDLLFAPEDPVNPDKPVNLCKGDEVIDVNLSYAEDGDFEEIQPGSLKAYNLRDATINPICTLTVKMKAMNEVAVFIVKRVMVNGAGEVSESVKNYCINQNVNAECDITTVDDVDDFGQDIWSDDTTVVGDARQLTFNLEEEATTNGVLEIRILPLKGVLAINTSQNTEDCTDDRQFRSIKITAEANCNTTYRGKEMFIPGSGNLGYSTLFDYGIYDTGLFQP